MRGPDRPAKELALSFFEALGRGAVGEALDLVEPAALVEIVPAALAGPASHHLAPFLDEVVRAFPDLLIHARSVMGTAALAVLEIKMEGTQAAEFFGVLNQEKHLDVDQAWMVWAARGRISAIRAYWCQNQLYRRLAVKRLDRVSILAR